METLCKPLSVSLRAGISWGSPHQIKPLPRTFIDWPSLIKSDVGVFLPPHSLKSARRRPVCSDILAALCFHHTSNSLEVKYKGRLLRFCNFKCFFVARESFFFPLSKVNVFFTILNFSNTIYWKRNTCSQSAQTVTALTWALISWRWLATFKYSLYLVCAF